jgi:hypothetical protein
MEKLIDNKEQKLVILSSQLKEKEAQLAEAERNVRVAI